MTKYIHCYVIRYVSSVRSCGHVLLVMTDVDVYLNDAMRFTSQL